MAITTVTIMISNTNQNPTVVKDSFNTTVISPTGITTPDTPYTEYVADSATIMDGSIQIPLWNKLQYATLPAASFLTIQTDNYDEAAYYANLDIEGAVITIEPKTLETLSITLNATEVTIDDVSEYSLVATINPSDITGATTDWESSDATVATVSDTGKVTAVSVGTATITTTVHAQGVTATASCVVTVEAHQ